MSSDITLFAETNFRNEKKKFGIKLDDRRRHMYLIGKTGMGKSVLIENLVYSDIAAGKGCCLIDPHGDSAELLVDCIPSYRMNDVIYFNPADIDYPIAFNVLEKVEPKYRHLVASGLVGVFKKIWADSWGPRLEYLLRNTILALLDYPDSTLLGVNRLLVDKDFRKQVVAKVQDPVVKMFWETEFTQYTQQFLTEAIAPIQNKVGQFLSTSLIRNVLGQVKSSIDLRKVMDEKKILILNMSKGRIGEDASALLGAMMITKIQLAAMSRVDIPEAERNDFYLYVDEFQNFQTDSFANILSEARKYHLCLVMANQYIEQLSEIVRPAVFGNVGTIVTFRVGSTDAEELVKEFSPKFTEEDIINLPKYHIYLRLMINGVASDPFSACTLPPISKITHSTEKIVRLTREHYSEARDIVEDKIARWSGIETEAMLQKLELEIENRKMTKFLDKKRIDFLTVMSGGYEAPDTALIKAEAEIKDRLVRRESGDYAAIDRKDDRPRREVNPEDIQVVTCSYCGVKTKINFKPDPSRPVLCKDCLKDFRRKQAEEETEGKRKESFNRATGGDRRGPPRDSRSFDAAPRRDSSERRDSRPPMSSARPSQSPRVNPSPRPISPSQMSRIADDSSDRAPVAEISLSALKVEKPTTAGTATHDD